MSSKNPRNITLIASFFLMMLFGNQIANSLQLTPCKDLIRRVRSRRIEIAWESKEE